MPSRSLVVLPDDSAQPILDAIGAASESIRVKMFVFSDPVLLKALFVFSLFVLSKFTLCGRNEPLQVAFHQVILRAVFHRGYGRFFPDCPRNEKEGDLQIF